MVSAAVAAEVNVMGLEGAETGEEVTLSSGDMGERFVVEMLAGGEVMLSESDVTDTFDGGDADRKSVV